MVVMSIVTWTLPTQGIPYLTKKIINHIHNNKLYNIISKHKVQLFVSTLVSLSFILVEGILIHQIVKYSYK